MEKEYQFIFFWTNSSPGSIKIKSIIENSEYNKIFTLACADKKEIRNSLLFGKYPQATVPLFAIVEDGKPTFYKPEDARKVFNLAGPLLEHLKKDDILSERGLSVANSSVMNLSFSSVANEEN